MPLSYLCINCVGLIVKKVLIIQAIQWKITFENNQSYNREYQKFDDVKTIEEISE